jgi:katanin p60 ATPase-containing subunit A1
MSGTLFAMKASSEAGSAEQRRNADRRRNILILIHAHLIEHGYCGAAEALQREAGLVMNRFEVADNMDMTLIMNDFESYYEMRFDRKPKLVRKLKEGEDKKFSSSKKNGSSATRTATTTANNLNNATISVTGGGSDNGGATKKPGALRAQVGNAAPSKSGEDGEDLPLAVVGAKEVPQARGRGSKNQEEDDTPLEDRLLKPPPQFGGDLEMRQLANIISHEIYQESPNVQFDDIVALEEPKRLLCEAVQLPLKFPYLFSGILRPWKGILLHGPPGTGKTLLAKAVATECRTTFFNISASTLVSKWRGDSEKLVRALFELARYHAPSTVFLDEIDSILGSRSGGGDGAATEHEASRRMKTELLIQMDGMNGSKSNAQGNEQVFVMAASNLPWDLDVAMLRRLEKRVLVGLPVVEAREAMLRKHLSDRAAADTDFTALAEKTKGYSGADIELVCREAAMKPVRRLMARLQSLGADGLLQTPRPPSDGAARSGEQAGGGKTAGSGKTHSLGVHLRQSPSVSPEEVDALLKSDPVTAEDMLAALATTRPSSDGNMNKYTDWQTEFGAV